MASIKLTISRGGVNSGAFSISSKSDPDMITIDVPIPERGASMITLTEYLQLIETTFDKTAELVDMVRGTVDDLADIEIAEAVES